jgi:hypothetical protein
MREAAAYFALLILVIAVLAVAGPRTRDDSGCLFCGRYRTEVWWLGLKIKDSLVENEASRWVDSIHPNHTIHVWATSSHFRKGWFNRGVIGCGGLGGCVANLHQFCKDLDKVKAQELLNLYHSQVQTNRANLREFLVTQFNPPSATNTNASSDSAPSL